MSFTAPAAQVTSLAAKAFRVYSQVVSPPFWPSPWSQFAGLSLPANLMDSLSGYVIDPRYLFER